MPIIYRSIKGSELTIAELDGNFMDLDDRVDTLETTPPTPVEISNITQTGATFTVHLDDGSQFGPFTLPTAAFDWRGDWAATTQYFVNDVFRVAGDGLFLVITAHESGTAFDPDAAEIARLLPDNRWYSGSGAPPAGLGDEGDFYLDTANGDVYQQQGTAGWVQIMNLTGPQGPAGADGADGADGTIVTALDDVPDVDYTTAGPSEGDYLRRRSGAWIDEAPSNLDDAPDVDYGSTGPSEGDILRRRSGAWVPEVPAATTWHFGTGAPSAGLGGEGDLYLDTASGDLYQHQGSSGWSLQANIEGPAPSSLDDIGDVAYGSPGPADGDTLGWSASAGVWMPQAGGGGGLTFIESQDASNSPSLDFTGFDATKYDGYLFVLSNVTPAIDADNLLFRSSSDGGSSYDSGASDYKANRSARDTSQANDAWTTRGGAASAIAVTTVQNVGSASGEDGVSGRFFVYGPHLAKRTMVEFAVNYINAGGNLETVTGGGLRDSAADVDAAQFIFLNGNIESGTITMYGLRNA